MIKDILIDIQLNHANIRKYEEKFGQKYERNQIITINQFDVLATSRIEVVCKCDICGNDFSRKRVYIEGKTTTCSMDCKKKMLLKNSKKAPNHQKDTIVISCSMCGESFKIIESQLVRKKKNVGHVSHRFCSKECYSNHRREFYRDFYYNTSMNDTRLETKPERLVREWLENNNIEYVQEQGLLRKYFLDFYIPKYNYIIEAYGDYWHVNPEVYDIYNNDNTKKKLHKNQREFIDSNRDKLRNDELESYGYKVFVLWEKDILSNLDNHISKIFKSQ